MDDLIKFSEIEAVLNEYAAQAVEIYRKNLALGDKRASRNLIDNVTAQVETEDGTAYEVNLSLAHYWKYVEGGSQGTVSSPVGAIYPAHRPPTGVLINWINVKPVLPRPAADGKIPSPKSLAYLIGRKIEREGIEPHPALAQTIEELNAMYKDKFILALSSDVGQYINKVLLSFPQGSMSQKI